MKKGYNNIPGIYFNYIPFHESDEKIVNDIIQSKVLRKEKKTSKFNSSFESI